MVSLAMYELEVLNDFAFIRKKVISIYHNHRVIVLHIPSEKNPAGV